MTEHTHRNGCFNRKPFMDKVLVQDGYARIDAATIEHLENGHAFTNVKQPVHKMIPFQNSYSCMHPTKRTDPSCAGCCWIDNDDPRDKK